MRNKLDEILLSENVRDNFHSSYNGEFKVWLDSLLPEIEKCASQKQDNPWHVYNCLDHILYSVEEMNKQTKKLPTWAEINSAHNIICWLQFPFRKRKN